MIKLGDSLPMSIPSSWKKLGWWWSPA